MLDVGLDQSAEWGSSVDWLNLAMDAVSAAFAVSSHGALAVAPFSVSISIKLSDNAEVQTLNRDWRGKDSATNVLSFPMLKPDDFGALSNSDDGEVLLGDMILAHGICTAEATEKAIPLPDHITHLMVHGTLHLLGYDHTDKHEGDIMEALEVKALASMGLGNPYDHPI